MPSRAATWVIIAGAGLSTSTSWAGTYQVLHAFNRSPDMGLEPGEITAGNDGSVYGNTAEGGPSDNTQPGCNNYYDPGSNGCGTFFRLLPDGKLKTLLTIYRSGASPDFAQPVVRDGQMFGVISTFSGYDAGHPHGYAFSINIDGTGLKRLHPFFNGIRKGFDPDGLLVTGGNGILYGGTEGGKDIGKGDLFSLAQDGAYTDLHNFNATGEDQLLSIAIDRDNNVFGTDLRFHDGRELPGTIFKFDTAKRVFSTIYKLDYQYTDYPAYLAGFDKAGNLYGWTQYGYTGKGGTLFEMHKDHGRYSYTLLYRFTTDDFYPNGLTVLPDGTLLGTAAGNYKKQAGGYLFSFVAGTLTDLHDFTNAATGTYPTGNLARLPTGQIVGTTTFGGDDSCTIATLKGCGVLFEYTP